MKIEPKKIPLHEDPPKQLVIKGGKLIAVDGTRPDFSGMPDGEYNLTTHEVLKGLRHDSLVRRNWAS